MAHKYVTLPTYVKIGKKTQYVYGYGEWFFTSDVEGDVSCKEFYNLKI